MIEFINRYKEDLKSLIDKVDPIVLSNIITQINDVEANKGQVYVLGNGGSASTASHMVNDLGAGLTRRDIKNLKIQSLSDNTASCSALSNDVGYENIFYYQLKGKLSKNDLIISISCSGNSENILKAVEYAKSQNVKTISFTGFDGGELKKISDLTIHIDTPKGSYGLVEDVHMILNHMIYSYYISTS